MRGFRHQHDDGAAALLDFAGPSRALVTLPMQPLARSTTLVISTLMLSSLAALAFIPIDKVVTGRGIVAAPNGTLVVQPLDISIVRAIHVEPGQLVRRGDVLAQLDPTFTGSDQSSRQEQVASLTAQIDRLQAEIAGRPYAPSLQDPVHVQQAALFEERMAEHRATLARFDAETGALQAQLLRAQTDVAIGTKRLDIATDLASRRAELQRLQVGSLMNTLAANDTQAQMQQSLEEAQSAVTAGQSALEAKASEREAYARGRIAHSEADLTVLQSRLSGAQAALAKANLRQGLVSLRAQADAVVLSVARVSVGSVLQSGAELITLVPNDAHLEVEAAVSGRDVGWVRPGQPVTVKFDTLPFSRYGTAQGTVRAISPASFTERSDPSAASLPRQDGTEPYYRVRVSLDRTALHDVPEGFRVLSGMPVAADVMVGRRTVMEYLLMRVLTPLQDGMREP